MVSSFPKILRSSASFSQSIRNRVRLKKLQAQAKNFCRVLDIRVPLRYNYDKPEKPRISRVFGYQARFFILFQPEKSSREVVIS